MPTRVGIVVFPGSNCDRDCHYVLSDVFHCRADYLWHTEGFGETDYDLVVLPGGFSYGDYLRAGAIARFSPIMDSVIRHAMRGRPLLGICNGFQVLCESHLLPGALVMNSGLLFRCETVQLTGCGPRSPYLRRIRDTTLYLPIAHREGNYIIDRDGLRELRDNGQIIFRYQMDINGSTDRIAGITNRDGNIIGMMPHPERASESILGNEDGKIVFSSILENIS